MPLFLSGVFVSESNGRITKGTFLCYMLCYVKLYFCLPVTLEFFNPICLNDFDFRFHFSVRLNFSGELSSFVCMGVKEFLNALRIETKRSAKKEPTINCKSQMEDKETVGKIC